MNSKFCQIFIYNFSLQNNSQDFKTKQDFKNQSLKTWSFLSSLSLNLYFFISIKFYLFSLFIWFQQSRPIVPAVPQHWLKYIMTKNKNKQQNQLVFCFTYSVQLQSVSLYFSRTHIALWSSNLAIQCQQENFKNYMTLFLRDLFIN